MHSSFVLSAQLSACYDLHPVVTYKTVGFRTVLFYHSQHNSLQHQRFSVVSVR